VRVWAHRVLGALCWVALVLLAVWRLPEVARTVACSIVVDDRRGDIERMGAGPICSSRDGGENVAAVGDVDQSAGNGAASDRVLVGGQDRVEPARRTSGRPQTATFRCAPVRPHTTKKPLHRPRIRGSCATA
jgi:hypothetical protein